MALLGAFANAQWSNFAQHNPETHHDSESKHWLLAMHEESYNPDVKSNSLDEMASAMLHENNRYADERSDDIPTFHVVHSASDQEEFPSKVPKRRSRPTKNQDALAPPTPPAKSSDSSQSSESSESSVSSDSSPSSESSSSSESSDEETKAKDNDVILPWRSTPSSKRDMVKNQEAPSSESSESSESSSVSSSEPSSSEEETNFFVPRKTPAAAPENLPKKKP